MKGKWILPYLKKYPSYLKYKLRTAKKPDSCIFAVTHRCNLKCVMCNFWKTKQDEKELTLNEIEALFNNDLMKNLKMMALTGGETLLRKDLSSIIDIIHDSLPIQLDINTNGFLPQKLDSLLKKSGDKIGGIQIPIDGLNEVHDKIRRVKNSFKLALESLEIAEKHGFKPTVNITLSPLNYQQLYNVYKYFKKYNFTCKPAQNSDYYFGNNSAIEFGLTKEMKLEIVKQIKKIDKKSINPFLVFLEDWLMKGTRPLPCYAGVTLMYIDAVGNIHPCIHKKSFGNIRTDSLKKIWHSPSVKEFRKTHKNCTSCYQRCSTDTFRINLLKWELKTKLKKFKMYKPALS